MILAIDAGNSRIKWRITNDGQQIAQGAQLTAKFLKGEVLSLSEIQSVKEIRIASVAGDEVVDSLKRQLLSQFSVPIHFAMVSAAMGELCCAYEDPETLGVDRWLAIAAA